MYVVKLLSIYLLHRKLKLESKSGSRTIEENCMVAKLLTTIS